MTLPQKRFAYLFFVVYVCLLVHIESVNDFDKAALEARLRYLIETKSQQNFCVLDSDHDGILTIEEAAQEIARRIDADPEEFHMFLDEKYGSWDSCWGGTQRQPGFGQIWASSFFVTAGRIDWTPCLMSLWTENLVQQFPGIKEWIFSESLDEEKFREGVLIIAEAIPVAETFKFRVELDEDQDGCLSKAEYDKYWTKWKLSPGASPWSAYINFSTVKDFSAIEEYIQLPRTKTVLNNVSCVDEVAWQMWSLEPIMDSYEDVWAGSHANQSCKTQTHIQAETDQDSTNLALAAVLGCCGLVAIVLMSRLALYSYRNRQYRVNLDEAKQVQKLLKAKIDAWSIFDVSLCTQACDLEPAFRHSLGLEGYQPETLDLTKIAHPEDAEVLKDMLAQLEGDLDSDSLPKMTKVHFVYGETGETAMKGYAITHVPVELLMAWGSETRSTVLVGITMLGEAPSTRSLPDAPDVEAPYEPKNASLSETAASVCSHGQFILNGSDVMSCGESEAATFRSMTANDHQGGQITKFFSDMKTGQIRDAFVQASAAALWHKTADQAPSDQAPSSTTADESRSSDHSSSGHGMTSL